MKPTDPDNWMRDDHPTLSYVVPSVDKEEHRDQRSGNRIVALAYGVLAILVIGG
jgi:uncharacterized membrane-anchored protein